VEAETRAPARELETAEVPWVVAYLREDLQDLRNDVRENSKAIRDSYERLDVKIDSLRNDVDTKIDSLRNDMYTKIDSLRNDMDAKIDSLRNDIAELRREMGTYVRWTITTMVAVGALVVAAIKLLP